MDRRVAGERQRSERIRPPAVREKGKDRDAEGTDSGRKAGRSATGDRKAKRSRTSVERKTGSSDAASQQMDR